MLQFDFVGNLGDGCNGVARHMSRAARHVAIAVALMSAGGFMTACTGDSTPQQTPSETSPGGGVTEPTVAGTVQPARIRGYSVSDDGSTLTIYADGRPGEALEGVRADEGSAEVVVVADRVIPDSPLEDVLIELEGEVSLIDPLGARVVLDSSGAPIPERPGT